jgi:hypothetical protein
MSQLLWQRLRVHEGQRGVVSPLFEQASALEDRVADSRLAYGSSQQDGAGEGDQAPPPRRALQYCGQ